MRRMMLMPNIWFPFNNYMKGQGVNLLPCLFANEPDYGYDWTWYS